MKNTKQPLLYYNGKSLRQVVCSIRLPEIVYGLSLLEFNTSFHIPVSEIYRRIGAKLSLDRKIMSACLLVLAGAGAIKFQHVGHEKFVEVIRYDR